MTTPKRHNNFVVTNPKDEYLKFPGQIIQNNCSKEALWALREDNLITQWNRKNNNERIYKQNEKFNRQKSLKRTKQKFWSEKYSEWNENCTREHPQQTWSSRKTFELEDKSLETIHSEEKKKKKKKSNGETYVNYGTPPR